MIFSNRFLYFIAFLFLLAGAIFFGPKLFFSKTSVVIDEKNTSHALLKVTEFKTSSFGTLVCAEGMVKNISSERLGYVSAIITFFDSDGVFDFSEGIIQSKRSIFTPGEIAKFKRCVTDTEHVIIPEKTKFEFRGKIGDVYEDKLLLFSTE